jgi:hypothetical protein
VSAVARQVSARTNSLSVILSAFNEAANVPVLLEAALAALPRVTDDFEVIWSTTAAPTPRRRPPSRTWTPGIRACG